MTNPKDNLGDTAKDIASAGHLLQWKPFSMERRHRFQTLAQRSPV